MMICEELLQIEDYQKVVEMQNSPTLQRLNGLLKRFHLIGWKIVSLFEGKNISPNQSHCISLIRNHYSKFFIDYEFKYVKFC